MSFRAIHIIINNPPMTEYIGARRHAISEQGRNRYEFFLKGKGRTFIKETIIADFSPVKALN